MTLTTEQLRARIAHYRELAYRYGVSGNPKHEAQYREDATFLEELLANREAQPVAELVYSSAMPRFIGDTNEIEGYRCWIHGETRLVSTMEQAYADAKAVCTAPPAPAPAAVKLPTEFYSDEGIVVRLEEVMAALAVVGVQYERKANAKTRCECSLPSLPEEMTGGIAMSKYKVKKSNYAQWVKGWNACRAAMLAQPVSQDYTLPEGFKLMPLEMTDEIGEAIAMEARCCGGIALCIYEAALSAAPEGGNDHDTRR